MPPAVSTRRLSSSRSSSSRHRTPVSHHRTSVSSSSSSSSSQRVSRRLLSLTLPSLLALGSTRSALAEVTKLQLSSRQRTAQLDGLTQLAYQKIVENHASLLTPESLSVMMSLLLSDAVDGGIVDGSIIAALRQTKGVDAGVAAVIDELEKLRISIEAGPLAENNKRFGTTDTLVLATKLAVTTEWRNAKIARAETKEGGELIATAFASAFPVKIGRVDGSTSSSTPKLFTSTSDINEFCELLSNTGVKKGRKLFTERQLFLLLPYAIGGDMPVAEDAMVAANFSSFDEWKRKYQKSRRTVTRTDYEVDFVEAFTRLVSNLAVFNEDAILTPRELNVVTLK